MSGGLITYYLAPVLRQNFDNQELGMSEPLGPYCVNDPRCDEGTLTAEEVLDYVVKMHGEAPVIIEREPWGESKDDPTSED